MVDVFLISYSSSQPAAAAAAAAPLPLSRVPVVDRRGLDKDQIRTGWRGFVAFSTNLDKGSSH